jgi:hypothetical protein
MAGPFELRLREIANRAGDRADQFVRGVMFELSARFIVRSPVDTGRFRGNWFYSFGARSTRTTGADVEAAAQIYQGGGGGYSAEVNGLREMPTQHLAGVHFITNNLPYAWPLERGHSGQAPQGIVGLTVLEFASIADGAAKRMTP